MAESSGNGAESEWAKWCTRTQAPSKPARSAACAKSTIWRTAAGPSGTGEVAQAPSTSVPADTQGVLVSDVEQGSPAFRQGAKGAVTRQIRARHCLAICVATYRVVHSRERCC